MMLPYLVHQLQAQVASRSCQKLLLPLSLAQAGLYQHENPASVQALDEQQLP